MRPLYVRRAFVSLSLTVPIVVFYLVWGSKLYWEYSGASGEGFISYKTPQQQIKEDRTYPLYRATKITSAETTLEAHLKLESEGSYNAGDSLELLQLKVFYEDSRILRVKISDVFEERWEPEDYNNTQFYFFNEYLFELTAYPFGFSVKRKSDNRVLFDTNSKWGGFYFADRYLEIGSILSHDSNVYGLGERTSSFRINTNNTRYTLWTLAQDTPFDTGQGARGKNMYGHHPFVLAMKDGKAHGLYFHNFNAMDFIFRNESLDIRSIGGLMDLYLFTGPQPEQVVRDYLGVIGKPALPPYWALGYHQCRWGYETLSQLSEVVFYHDKLEIPLDVMWVDIDYMKYFRDFTLDYSRYPLNNFKAFIEQLHSSNKYFVPILDAGVAAHDYFAYNRGKELDVFIKRNKNSSKPFFGQVWPGKSVFVDFFHPNASKYWEEMLDQLYTDVEFDGLWLDMNEASSFCDGECPQYYESKEVRPELLYVPGNHSLEDQVLPLSAYHYNGIKEYNAHSLWGTMETKLTYRYLAKKLRTRPFILSRSTRAGHGKYGYHWLGDNYSKWSQLRYSIPGVLNFQLFGIPLVGADVCGFHNNTTPELCSRWLQVGAFYPFFRNHNDIGSKSQELYALGEEVMAIGRSMIRLRYSLSLYLYSCLFSASLLGNTVIKPLFFPFPENSETYQIESQFMVGEALMVAPVVYEGKFELEVYFPNTIWYDFFTGNLKIKGWETIYTPLDKVNLFVRSGFVIPLQDSSEAMTITSMRSRPVQLLVALDSRQNAKGEIYLDDGVSLNTINNKLYSKIVVKVEEGTKLTTEELVRGYSGDFKEVSQITVLGRRPGILGVTGKGVDTWGVFGGALEIKGSWNISSIDLIIH